ncbi:unnamed protein product [Dibothriocephalus latus]|uniref:Gelsolin-like domain-containing protein n=1 Tax=Dibothriocephalus latus TaxID=60516 RepID=A0A3P7LF90_DIBLA|nr:unnamed protein product [Dibothriocephalus latus]
MLIELRLLQIRQEKKELGVIKSRPFLSDETGKLILTKVYSGNIYRDGINPDDVTFVEDIDVLYVYIGPGASKNEGLSAWDEAIVRI